jgi:hypothetical protein
VSLLVYAIAEAGAGAVGGTGFESRSLYRVTEGRLVALVSDHPGGSPRPTSDTLREYEHTIERLMDCGTILPARFGSILVDESAVRAMLQRRCNDLLAALHRVRGAVELGLRASSHRTPKLPAPAGRQSGTTYMHDRLAQQRRAREVASELEPLAAVARSSRRQQYPAPALPLLDAYLVDRERVDEFIALVEQLDNRLEDLELVCTGPWPPYSFAEGARA